MFFNINFSNNSIQYKLSNLPETDFQTIKTAFYNEMKNFITVPLIFKGCNDSKSSKKKLIFENIMFRHNEDIARCYYSSHELFNRLEQGLKQFNEWAILGEIDIEEFAEQYLVDVADWERNFRILRLRGQDAEKLPK